jgi:hypothetical protein
MALKVRKLKLVCLNHANVVEYDDTGNVQGEYSSNRQAIKRILDKTTDLGDGRKVKTFMLAEKPKDVFSEDDEFDMNVLRNSDGDWRLPTDAWKQERERRIEAARRSAENAQQKADDILRREVADGVVELLASTTARTKRTGAKKGAEE